MMTFSLAEIRTRSLLLILIERFKKKKGRKYWMIWWLERIQLPLNNHHKILEDPELPPPSNTFNAITVTLPTTNHLHKLVVISPLGDCNHLLTGLNTPHHRFSPNHTSYQRAGILASTNLIALWSQLHPGSPFLPTRGQTRTGTPHLEGPPLPPSPRELLILQFHHSPHFSDPFPDFNACENAPSKAQGVLRVLVDVLLCHYQIHACLSSLPLRNSGRLFSHRCFPRAMLIAWHSTDTKYLLHRKPINRWMPNPMEMTKGIEDWWQDHFQFRKPKKVRYSHTWFQRDSTQSVMKERPKGRTDQITRLCKGKAAWVATVQLSRSDWRCWAHTAKAYLPWGQVFRQQVGRGPTSPTGEVTLAATWNGSPRAPLPCHPPPTSQRARVAG